MASMTEYELDKMCEQQTQCDCNCMSCQLFAKYKQSNR